jgi:adenosine/AMP kinase
MSELKFDVIKLEPNDENIIIGQSHFIKTVEDIYEAIITSSPSIKFGIAFNEASGKRLVRFDGNDTELIEKAKNAAKAIGAGHVFVIYLKGGFPINVMKKLKEVDEIVTLYAATGNPLKVVVADYEGDRGIMGVIDGASPLGFEGEEDKKERYEFLRKIGYKR